MPPARGDGVRAIYQRRQLHTDGRRAGRNHKRLLTTPPKALLSQIATGGETHTSRYFWDGVYSMDAAQRFSWTCRDFRANESKLIDPRLMDLLFVLHWRYCRDEIKIFSGYRTPQTNAQLEGAALNSQHIQAKALDIHLPNIDNDAVAVDFRTIVYGGVGMYPGRDFTHIDLGSLRRWVG